MRRLLALGLTLVTALAGCLQPPGTPAVDPAPEGRTGGTMTAEEERTDAATICTEGLDLTSDRRFCATRTITVEGTLAGFRALDVGLETFNGDLKVVEGDEGEWGFVATLTGRGATADAATAAIDAIGFSWSHEENGAHFVEVIAEHEGEARDLAASIVLTMPRSLVMTLVAATSNGAIDLAGKTDKLALVTSNGPIVVRADVTQVSLTTSNGAVEAQLRPTADGRWTLTTSNGDVTLAIPEGAPYGYSLEGTTSNGEVEYKLRDGAKGPCPQGSEYYTPPCDHRSFTTSGFGSREHQVHAVLLTSNGDVAAAPS